MMIMTPTLMTESMVTWSLYIQLHIIFFGQNVNQILVGHLYPKQYSTNLVLRINYYSFDTIY